MRRALTVLCLLALAAAFPAAGAQEGPSLSLAPPRIGGVLAGYRLAVQAAGAGAGYVLLDTGAQGLMLFAEHLDASRTRPTGRRMLQAFEDGTVFEGEIVLARIGLEGGVVLENLPVLAVRRVDCQRDRPDCPGRRLREAHLAGVMGVALGGSDFLPNPLGFAPGGLSEGFILRGGGGRKPPRLTLGLAGADRTGFVFPPRPAVSAAPREALYDRNALPACFRVEGAGGRKICGSVLFDTGASASLLALPPGVKPAGLPQNGFLPGGRTVTLSLPGLPDSRTIAGSTPWVDQIKIVPDASGKSILGAGFLKGFDLLYDLRRQTIGIRPAL